MIDFDSDFGQRVLQRLAGEEVIWLVTVGKDLTPQPRPVWFLWTGSTFLVFSRPNTHKIDHISRVGRVSLHLNSDPQGGDVVVFTGAARVLEDPPPDDEISAFLEKYREGLKRIGYTPDHFRGDYSVAIRVQPGKLRGF